MTAPVKLLFGVHAHQPVGNFPEVIDGAHRRCYGPFLDAMDRHPEFGFSIHISGWLLEYLAAHHPADVRRLRAMVKRGQAEVVGGGDMEPVLSAIGERDRLDQLRALSRRLVRHFGARPRGAWLAERVWETSVVPALAQSGIRYVAVDDYHFLCTGASAASLDGYFTTEEDGHSLDLFPISETLRYKFPFAPVRDVVGYLESLRPGGAAIYFDDIEKFGVWPETHEWVFERGWLEEFIRAALASPAVEVVKFADYHARERTRGIVYLPTLSYAEMNEWTLTPAPARRYSTLVSRSTHEGTLGEDKPLLRGGIWRNFFSRYSESNWMHKRMLGLSRRYHSLGASRKTSAMQVWLHRAQANDPYWHGLFGGIYLPHLRRAVYAALARLEFEIDRVSPRPPSETLDVDLDGQQEAVLHSDGASVWIRPAPFAHACEFTSYPLAHNFGDALTRREEHYFEKIRRDPGTRRVANPGAAGIASIHERTEFRTQIATADLETDSLPRGLFLDYWRGSNDPAPAPVEYARSAVGPGADATFFAQREAFDIEKRYSVVGQALTVEYRLRARSWIAGAMTVELNIAMPSCDGPAGRYRIGDEVPGGFGQAFHFEDVGALDLEDDELRGTLRLALRPAALIDAAPLHTVSQSEAGFEKIMQAATVRIIWPIEVVPGDEIVRTVSARVAEM